MIRALAAVAVVAAAVLAVDLAQVRWDAIAPAMCMPHDCFCESVRPFGVRQLANTWSNLGFVFVGALVWPRRRLAGAVIAFMGVGSAFYHASLSFAGQWVDNISMYLFPTLLLIPRALPYVAVNAALAAAAWLVPEGRRILFVALVVAVAARELGWRRPRMRWLGAAALAFVAGGVCWVLDRNHTICWGHAAWHLLCALAAGFLFLHLDENLPAAEARATV